MNEISEESVTLPIDKIVVRMLKEKDQPAEGRLT
jgi:hypothetical protein